MHGIVHSISTSQWREGGGSGVLCYALSHKATWKRGAASVIASVLPSAGPMPPMSGLPQWP
jgi:hypothetical protein